MTPRELVEECCGPHDGPGITLNTESKNLLTYIIEAIVYPDITKWTYARYLGLTWSEIDAKLKGDKDE